MNEELEELHKAYVKVGGKLNLKTFERSYKADPSRFINDLNNSYPSLNTNSLLVKKKDNTPSSLGARVGLLASQSQQRSGNSGQGSPQRATSESSSESLSKAWSDYQNVGGKLDFDKFKYSHNVNPERFENDLKKNYSIDLSSYSESSNQTTQPTPTAPKVDANEPKVSTQTSDKKDLTPEEPKITNGEYKLPLPIEGLRRRKYGGVDPKKNRRDRLFSVIDDARENALEKEAINQPDAIVSSDNLAVEQPLKQQPLRLADTKDRVEADLKRIAPENAIEQEIAEVELSKLYGDAIYTNVSDDEIAAIKEKAKAFGREIKNIENYGLLDPTLFNDFTEDELKANYNLIIEKANEKTYTETEGSYEVVDGVLQRVDDTPVLNLGQVNQQETVYRPTTKVSLWLRENNEIGDAFNDINLEEFDSYIRENHQRLLDDRFYIQKLNSKRDQQKIFGGYLAWKSNRLRHDSDVFVSRFFLNGDKESYDKIDEIRDENLALQELSSSIDKSLYTKRDALRDEWEQTFQTSLADIEKGDGSIGDYTNVYLLDPLAGTVNAVSPIPFSIGAGIFGLGAAGSRVISSGLGVDENNIVTDFFDGLVEKTNEISEFIKIPKNDRSFYNEIKYYDVMVDMDGTTMRLKEDANGTFTDPDGNIVQRPAMLPEPVETEEEYSFTGLVPEAAHQVALMYTTLQTFGAGAIRQSIGMSLGFYNDSYEEGLAQTGDEKIAHAYAMSSGAIETLFSKLNPDRKLFGMKGVKQQILESIVNATGDKVEAGLRAGRRFVANNMAENIEELATEGTMLGVNKAFNVVTDSDFSTTMEKHEALNIVALTTLSSGAPQLATSIRDYRERARSQEHAIILNAYNDEAYTSLKEILQSEDVKKGLGEDVVSEIEGKLDKYRKYSSKTGENLSPGQVEGIVPLLQKKEELEGKKSVADENFKQEIQEEINKVDEEIKSIKKKGINLNAKKGSELYTEEDVVESQEIDVTQEFDEINAKIENGEISVEEQIKILTDEANDYDDIGDTESANKNRALIDRLNENYNELDSPINPDAPSETTQDTTELPTPREIRIGSKIFTFNGETWVDNNGKEISKNAKKKLDKIEPPLEKRIGDRYIIDGEVFTMMDDGGGKVVLSNDNRVIEVPDIATLYNLNPDKIDLSFNGDQYTFTENGIRYYVDEVTDDGVVVSYGRGKSQLTTLRTAKALEIAKTIQNENQQESEFQNEQDTTEVQEVSESGEQQVVETTEEAEVEPIPQGQQYEFIVPQQIDNVVEKLSQEVELTEGEVDIVANWADRERNKILDSNLDDDTKLDYLEAIDRFETDVINSIASTTQQTTQAPTETQATESTVEVAPTQDDASNVLNRYTTKNGKYVVELTDKGLVLKKPDGTDATIKKPDPYFIEAIKAGIFPETSLDEPPAFSNEKDANDWVIENTQNPLDLVPLLFNTKERLDAEEALEQGYITREEQIIAEELGRVNADSYRRYGDKNKITQSMARAYFRKKQDEGTLGGLDVIAQEMSGIAGVEITVQDIVEFMEKYPTGTQNVTNMRNPEFDTLLDKFVSLTNINPTPKTLAALLEINEQPEIDKDVLDKQDLQDKNKSAQEYDKWFESLNEEEKTKEIAKTYSYEKDNQRDNQRDENQSVSNQAPESGVVGVETTGERTNQEEITPTQDDETHFSASDSERDSFNGRSKKPATLESIQKKYPDAVVVQSESDLPKEIRDEKKKRGIKGDIDGVLHNGKVYMVADAIPDMGIADGIYRHEVLGHKGVISYLGDKLDDYAMNIVNRAKGKQLKALQDIAKRYGLPTDLSQLTPEQKSTLGQEYIAKISENRSGNPTAWNNLVAMIREALRDLGINLKVSDTEIQALIGMVERAKIESDSDVETRFIADETITEESSQGLSSSSVEATAKALELTDKTNEELDNLYNSLSNSSNKEVRTLSNMVENVQEKNERNSILNASLKEVANKIDDIFNQSTYFLDKREGRESKEVAEKYMGYVSKQDAIKDFKDAFFGNPESWLADALKMRESVRVYMENGGTFKELLSLVQKDFEGDGFTEFDAASVIKGKLDSLTKKDFRQQQISEAYHKAKADGSNPELVKAVEELIGKSSQERETKTNESNNIKFSISQANDISDTARRIAAKESIWQRLKKEANRQINNTVNTKLGFNKRDAGAILGIKDAKRSFDANIAAAEAMIDADMINLHRTVGRDIKGTKSQRRAKSRIVNRYLAGETSTKPSFLSKASIAVLDELRLKLDINSDKIVLQLDESIDQLNEALDVATNKVQRKAIQESLAKVTALKETIIDSKGKYLNRSYRIFSDPNYKPSERVVQRAIDYFVDNGMSVEDAEITVNRIIEDAKDSNPVDFAQSMSGSTSNNILKKRKTLDDSILDLLGVYDDPIYNYGNTAIQQAKLITAYEYQKNLRIMLVGSGVASPVDKVGLVKAFPDSKGWSILNDLFVSPEIADFISDQNHTTLFIGTDDNFYNSFVVLTQKVKLMKTVFSVSTAMRNFFSGAIMLASTGQVTLNPRTIREAAILAWKDNPKDRKEYMEKLIKLNILRDGGMSGELQKVLRDTRRGKGAFSEGSLAKHTKAGKIANLPLRFYRFGDDFYKVIGFEVEKKALMGYGMTEAQAEKEAARRITMTYPTYSHTTVNIKRLRTIPWIGTFVSFPAEIMRTTINNISIGHRDIKEGRTALGVKRLTGTIAIANILPVALSLISRIDLMDDEEEESVRKFFPEWNQNSLLYYTKFGDNEVEMMDLSAFFPMATYQKPITAALRGVDDKEYNRAAFEMSWELLSPYIGADITADGIWNAMNNDNGFGGKIAKSEEFGEKVVAYSDFIARKMGPGTYGNVKELLQANGLIGEKVTAYGKEYTNKTALLGLAGIRMQTVNLKSAIAFNSGKIQNENSMFRGNIKSQLRTTSDLSDDDVKKLAERYVNVNKEFYDEILGFIAAGRKAKMNEKDIMFALNNSGRGIGMQDVGALMSGINPYKNGFNKADINKEIKTIHNNEMSVKDRNEYIEKVLKRFSKFNNYIAEFHEY